MPLLCPGGFDTCTTRLVARERLRKNDTDGMHFAILRASARSSTVIIEILNPTTNLIWSRCVARVLCVDTGQRNQDGGDYDAPGRLRALHVPERLDTVFRTRPR